MGRGDEELYVYGLARPGLPAKLTILRHPLRTIDLSGMQAIVETVAARPQPTIEALQTQHSIVARLADRVPALLPARFGSIMTESALRAAVDANRSVISDTLRRVSDSVQMTIRIFGRPDLSSPAAPAATGTAFLLQRRARAHHVPAEVEVIRELLRAHATDDRVEPGDRLLRVTVFHLVRRKSIDAYRKKASGLHSMLAPYQVTISGPAPVFAFAPDLF